MFRQSKGSEAETNHSSVAECSPEKVDGTWHDISNGKIS